MKLECFMQVMESIAPCALAMDFDNPGLLVGTRREIKKVLVALDCTPAVAREAAEGGFDLVLSHHPLFFHAVKRILPDAPDTAAAYALIQSGIGLFAAHTNLDAAQGGVNDCLCEALGLVDTAMLPPDNLGRLGSIPGDMTLGALAEYVKQRLCAAVRFCGEDTAPVRRAAVIGGAGGSELCSAVAAGADVLITGEVKHNHALDALQLGLGIIEAGHYETERVVLVPMIKRLQVLTNDVQYKVACCETACLKGV